jgi:anti-anti-sigma factor
MDRDAASRDLHITLSHAEGARVLRLRGEFDMAGVALFERELLRGSQRDEATLVLDLRELTFIDSSGLRAVLMADHRARADGRRCLVVKGPTRIKRVLDVSGVNDRLELVDEYPPVATQPG